MRHAVLSDAYLEAAGVLIKAARRLYMDDDAGAAEARVRAEELRTAAAIHHAAYLEGETRLSVIEGGRGA